MAATKTVTKTAPAAKAAAKPGPAKTADKAEKPAAKAPAKAAPAPVKAPVKTPLKAEKAKPAAAAKSASNAKAAAPVNPAAPAKASTPPPAPMKAPDTKPAKQAAKPAEAPAPKPAAKAPAKPASKSAAKSSKKAASSVLSEAELLAMGEDDYMNEAQLTFFRTKLEAMREEILDNARETGEHLKENEVFADPNDRATVEEENMLEQRVRDRERKLLKKIESTLNRIESGDYGYCKETGEPIGLPRLLARPTADLSIEAQEKHERLEKLYAD